MQRQEPWAGVPLDEASDLPIEIGRLPAGEAPKARGVAHRSAAMFDEPTPRSEGATSAAAIRQRWPEQE